MKKIIGIILLVLGIGLFGFVLFNQSKVSQINRTFSPYSMLSSSWEKYKVQFISPEGRVLDHSQNDITTSEGQSYAMLRAVWIDDKATFDLVWKFTKENMKRPNDNLFGWRYGQKENGEFGLLADGGDNSASDADTDIALALIFASSRWNDQKYLSEVKPILGDIWKLEVDQGAGRNYLVAGNWAKGGDDLIINPSYFSPYAWRIFHQVDGEYAWESLIDPAYDLLKKVGEDKLNKDRGVGIAPDWVALNRKDGSIHAPNETQLKTDYSFDAMRVPFRIGLDFEWYGDGRAKEYLSSSYELFKQQYEQTGMLPASYDHAGIILNPSENPAMYSTSLGYFKTTNPDLAKRVYEDKIIKLYANEQDSFNSDLGYYDQNWLWFGTAFYNNFLINLYNSK